MCSIGGGGECAMNKSNKEVDSDQERAALKAWSSNEVALHTAYHRNSKPNER